MPLSRARGVERERSALSWRYQHLRRSMSTVSLQRVGGELLLSPQSVEIINLVILRSGRLGCSDARPDHPLLVHLIATLARLMGPGGLRSVVSWIGLSQAATAIRSRGTESLRVGSDPRLRVCLFMRPTRVTVARAIVLRPSTILEFHRRLCHPQVPLASPKRRRTGPQGPSKASRCHRRMKRRNPRWGCPRIAQQIASQGRGAPSARYDYRVVRPG